MTAPPAKSLGSIRSLRSALANRITQPAKLAGQALANANQNPSRNTYLWQDPGWTLREAERVEAMPASEGGPFGDGRDTLWGLPISVKDCFDLAGAPTSCGVKFYRDLNGIASRDSWLVEAAARRGRGDYRQDPPASPRLRHHRRKPRVRRLPSTRQGRRAHRRLFIRRMRKRAGGLSRCRHRHRYRRFRSRAGRIVRAGRLSRFAGPRQLARRRPPGRIVRHHGLALSRSRGSPAAGRASSSPREPAYTPAYTRFAVVDDSFLHDCEPEILAGYTNTIAELEALGLRATTIDVAWWSESSEIFAPIQAWEAAALHAGHFDQVETSIRERLQWGASITPSEICIAARTPRCIPRAHG